MRVSKAQDSPIGLLTHHLVHDAAAWALMELIFEATAGKPGCAWENPAALAG